MRKLDEGYKLICSVISMSINGRMNEPRKSAIKLITFWCFISFGFSGSERVLSWIKCCMSDTAFSTFCLSSAYKSAFSINIPGRRERWQIIFSGWKLVSKIMRPDLLRKRVANPIKIVNTASL
jgi:hypothetical protein